jgi:hypothetical protein
MASALTDALIAARAKGESLSRWLSCRCVSADFSVRKIGVELLRFGNENGVHFALLLGSQKSRRLWKVCSF